MQWWGLPEAHPIHPQAGGRSSSLPPGLDQAGALLRTTSLPARLVSATPDPASRCPITITGSKDAQPYLPSSPQAPLDEPECAASVSPVQPAVTHVDAQ